MNKKIKNKLFSKCLESILTEIPEFVEYSEKSIYIAPGEVLFRSMTLINQKAAFIILKPHNKYDKVTVEVGWSSSGFFPKLIQRPSGGSAQESEMLLRSEAVVRVPSIRTLSGMMDDWLPVSAGEEEIVSGQIMRMLLNDGIPYLLRVNK